MTIIHSLLGMPNNMKVMRCCWLLLLPQLFLLGVNEILKYSKLSFRSTAFIRAHSITHGNCVIVVVPSQQEDGSVCSERTLKEIKCLPLTKRNGERLALDLFAFSVISKERTLQETLFHLKSLKANLYRYIVYNESFHWKNDETVRLIVQRRFISHFLKRKQRKKESKSSRAPSQMECEMTNSPNDVKLLSADRIILYLN